MKSNTYNHLLFLTEDDVSNLMSGKNCKIQGFYTKIQTDPDVLDFVSINENIAFYNIKFADTESVTKNGKKIEISISSKNSELYDFIYDSLDDNEESDHKYSFKIEHKNNYHYIVVTTLEYFEKSKIFV